MTTKAQGAVYITLVCLGVVLTASFVMLLIYNMNIFGLLLIIYMIGYSIFIFVLLVLKKQQLKGDLRYDAANYISLFNIFFGASMFVLGMFVFIKTKNGGSMIK